MPDVHVELEAHERASVKRIPAVWEKADRVVATARHVVLYREDSLPLYLSHSLVLMAWGVSQADFKARMLKETSALLRQTTPRDTRIDYVILALGGLLASIALVLLWLR
jgi:hypothetical protein